MQMGILSVKHCSSLFVLLLVASACAFPLCAQEKDDALPKKEVKVREGESFRAGFVRPGQVVKHLRRTGVPFRNETERLSLLPQSSPVGPPYSTTADGQYVLPRLGVCPESGVMRDPVGHYSLFSEVLDFVVYDPTDTAEARRAAESPLYSVAYLAETPLKETDDRFSIWPIHALRLGVACLPARVHFITEAGARFLEVRSGPIAWAVENAVPGNTSSQQSVTPQ
jgi:hypothetical protein